MNFFILSLFSLWVLYLPLIFSSSISSFPPITNITNICGENSTIGTMIINAVNLSYPGLEQVAQYANQNDYNAACEALANYYQYSNTTYWLRIPPVTPGNQTAGGIVDEMVFHDIFYLAGVATTQFVPRNADGGLNWTYKGIYNDPEFMNCLNRHDSFAYLLSAWRETGNSIYELYFDALVKDWVLHLPCQNALLTNGTTCYPIATNSPTCTFSDTAMDQKCVTGTFESPWRLLELGIRTAGIWPVAFYGFQQSQNFSTSARVLFILAINEHNQALMVDGGHPPTTGTPNWEMTQWQGLVSSVLTFPELKNTSYYLSYALNVLEELLDSGVYPDGVETEEASGYDMGTASDFFNTLAFLQDAGDNTPPVTFKNKVEQMWNYGTYISDAMGCLPRNGDSDLCGSGYNPTVTTYFGRNDWTYVHTNGAQGTVPPQFSTQGPSSVFPWAGQILLRSSYSHNATSVYFDIGPYSSSGHGHRDKLNLLVHARGSMLLVDSGRFSYAGTDLSATLHIEYARNTSAHNSVIIDMCDQLPYPAVATSPIPNESVSFTPLVDTAYGNMSYYNGLVGTAVHTRAVYYQRPSGATDPLFSNDGDFIVVIDMISSDRNRQIQASWHTHPNSTNITVDPTTGMGSVGGVNYLTGQPTSAQACVIPSIANAYSLPWKFTNLVRGQYQNTTNNTIWAGWYSQTYDDAWPSTTLIYENSVTTGNTLLGWLIIPSATPVSCTGNTMEILSIPTNSNQNVSVKVNIMGQGTYNIQVPIGPLPM